MDTVENDIFVVRQSHTSAFEALSTEEAQLNDAVKAMEAEILEWLSGEDSSKGSRPATAGARPGTSGPVHARSKVAAMINQVRSQSMICSILSRSPPLKQIVIYTCMCYLAAAASPRSCCSGSDSERGRGEHGRMG